MASPSDRRPLRGRVVAVVVAGFASALVLSLFADAAGGAPSPKPAKLVELESKQAGAAAKKGAWADAVAHLETALDAAREAAPLDVRDAIVTRTPHGGLGIYEPVDGGRVARRDVKLYVEVANAGHRATAEGTSEVFLEVSASFQYEDGTELGERALGSHRYRTRRKTGVLSFGLDVALSEKAPAGRYDLVLKVHDHVTGKTATRPVFFVLPELGELPDEKQGNRVR